MLIGIILILTVILVVGCQKPKREGTTKGGDIIKKPDTTKKPVTPPKTTTTPTIDTDAIEKDISVDEGELNEVDTLDQSLGSDDISDLDTTLDDIGQI